MRRGRIPGGVLLAVGVGIGTWVAFDGRDARVRLDEPTTNVDEEGLAPRPVDPPETRAIGLAGAGTKLPATTTGSTDVPRDLAGRTIEVQVDDHERQPFAGLTVVAVSEDGAAEVVGVTDAAGRASLVVPWTRDGRVFVRRAGRELASQSLDVVRAGGGPIRLFAPRRESLVTRVTRDGTPFLPPSFSIRVGGAAVTVQMTSPQDGVIVGSFAPAEDPKPVALTFAASGFPERGIPVLYEPDHVGVDVNVELNPAGSSLSIEARSPREILEMFTIERWDDAKGAWDVFRFIPTSLAGYVQGAWLVRVDDLAAGRYLVRESLANTRSEPVTLATGGTPAIVRFDFSKAGTVRGRVLVPSALASGDVQVGVWDGLRAEGLPRATMSVSGPEYSFSVQVPGDRPVTVGALHALGAAYGDSGTVTLVEPRDDVVLRVEAAASATIELEAPDGDTARPTSIWVYIWDPVAKHLTWQHHVTLDGGAFNFGGFSPGPCDIVVDDLTHAPLVLSGVTLGSGSTNLGRHKLSYGLSIRIRRVVPDGMVVPDSIVANAERIDEPRVGSWSRTSNRDRIRGLVPGRYRVYFFANERLPPASGMSQTVDVVEGQDAEATIDFHGPQAAVPPK